MNIQIHSQHNQVNIQYYKTVNLITLYQLNIFNTNNSQTKCIFFGDIIMI